MGRLFAFGNRRLVGYLAFISAFAPLSTDMYLPALPRMAEALGTDEAAIGLTVSGFFLVYSLSMLLWGPFSDKFGRRPVLLLGCALYVVSSLAVASADAIEPLLVWRGAQALASGAISAMAMTVVKDILRGKTLETAITWMQTITLLSPMLAPVLAGALGLKETCPPAKRNKGPLRDTLGRLFVVLGQRRFALPLLLFSAASAMPFIAYLGISAFVFQNAFGLTPQLYSLFFAGNAAACILGPVLHMLVFRHLRRSRAITCHLLVTCLFGLSLCRFGGTGPWTFALLYACISVAGCALRPPATVLMLESIEGDNGAVTALINCGGLLFGSFSISLAALSFWSALNADNGPILAAGLISAIVGGLGLVGWWALLRSGIVREQ